MAFLPVSTNSSPIEMAVMALWAILAGAVLASRTHCCHILSENCKLTSNQCNWFSLISTIVKADLFFLAK
jgi:hypothetical protein